MNEFFNNRMAQQRKATEAGVCGYDVTAWEHRLGDAYEACGDEARYIIKDGSVLSPLPTFLACVHHAQNYTDPVAGWDVFKLKERRYLHPHDPSFTVVDLVDQQGTMRATLNLESDQTYRGWQINERPLDGADNPVVGLTT